MDAAILEWYNEYVTGPDSFRRVIRYKLEHIEIVGTCWIWPGKYGVVRTTISLLLKGRTW